MCVLAYQVHIKRPAYLRTTVTPAGNPRQLRGPVVIFFSFHELRRSAETRAYSVAAPTLWNPLLGSVTLEGNVVSFRRRLKTCLFNVAYSPSLSTTFVHPLTTLALYTVMRLLSILVVAPLSVIFLGYWRTRIIYCYYYKR